MNNSKKDSMIKYDNDTSSSIIVLSKNGKTLLVFENNEIVVYKKETDGSLQWSRTDNPIKILNIVTDIVINDEGTLFSFGNDANIIKTYQYHENKHIWEEIYLQNNCKLANNNNGNNNGNDDNNAHNEIFLCENKLKIINNTRITNYETKLKRKIVKMEINPINIIYPKNNTVLSILFTTNDISLDEIIENEYLTLSPSNVGEIIDMRLVEDGYRLNADLKIYKNKNISNVRIKYFDAEEINDEITFIVNTIQPELKNLEITNDITYNERNSNLLLEFSSDIESSNEIQVSKESDSIRFLKIEGVGAVWRVPIVAKDDNIQEIIPIKVDFRDDIFLTKLQVDTIKPSFNAIYIEPRILVESAKVLIRFSKPFLENNINQFIRIEPPGVATLERMVTDDDGKTYTGNLLINKTNKPNEERCKTVNNKIIIEYSPQAIEGVGYFDVDISLGQFSPPQLLFSSNGRKLIASSQSLCHTKFKIMVYELNQNTNSWRQIGNTIELDKKEDYLSDIATNNDGSLIYCNNQIFNFSIELQKWKRITNECLNIDEPESVRHITMTSDSSIVSIDKMCKITNFDLSLMDYNDILEFDEKPEDEEPEPADEVQVIDDNIIITYQEESNEENIGVEDGEDVVFDIEEEVEIVRSDILMFKEQGVKKDDFDCIENIILIDNEITNYENIVSSVNSKTFAIIYSSETDRDDIRETINELPLFEHSIRRFAILCHGGKMAFISNENFFDKGTIKNANVDFIIKLATEYKIQNIDYLACNSLQNDDWKRYYDFIEAEIPTVIVGASEDETGNLKYGGDWVMETTGENIENEYFTERIGYYKYLFATTVEDYFNLGYTVQGVLDEGISAAEIISSGFYSDSEMLEAGIWLQLGGEIGGEIVEDFNGWSVSLSEDGTRVAIGAKNNGGNGTGSGHVRVFEYSDVDISWTQLGGDMDGEAVVDNNGYSVSLSADGTKVAMGAVGNDGNGSNSGRVRVFEYSGSSWTQLGGDIDGEVANDNDGYSVSLSADGTKVAMGAVGNDGMGYGSGHVRVFEYSGSSWTQLGGDIDGEAAGDQNGYSVSLSADGMKVAMGATNNDGNGSNSGHVRIYEYIGSSWTQLGGDIDGEAADDSNGNSVSLSADGTRVAMGALGNDVNGNLSGQVRVFEYSGSSWTQLGQDINGDAADDRNGYSVSLSGDGTRVAMGAYYNDGNGNASGQVRVFEYSGSSWTQISQDIYGEELTRIGFSVSLSADGTKLATGAPYNIGNGYVKVFNGEKPLSYVILNELLITPNNVVYSGDYSNNVEMTFDSEDITNTDILSYLSVTPTNVGTIQNVTGTGLTRYATFIAANYIEETDCSFIYNSEDDYKEFSFSVSTLQSINNIIFNPEDLIGNEVNTQVDVELKIPIGYDISPYITIEPSYIASTDAFVTIDNGKTWRSTLYKTKDMNMLENVLRVDLTSTIDNVVSIAYFDAFESTDIILLDTNSNRTGIERQVTSLEITPLNIILPDTSLNFTVQFTTNNVSLGQIQTNDYMEIDPPTTGTITNLELINEGFGLTGKFTANTNIDNNAALLSYIEDVYIQGVKEFEINTVSDLLVEGFSLTNTNITYENQAASNVTITLNTDDVSNNDILDAFTIVPTGCAIVKDIQGDGYTRTLTLEPTLYKSVTDASLNFNYNKDGLIANASLSFSVDTVQMLVNSEVALNPAHIYGDISETTELQIVFRIPYNLEESDISINPNYIVSWGGLQTSDNKTWTVILTRTTGINLLNNSITLDINTSDISINSTVIFNAIASESLIIQDGEGEDVIKKELTNIIMTPENYTYGTVSGSFEIHFTTNSQTSEEIINEDYVKLLPSNVGEISNVQLSNEGFYVVGDLSMNDNIENSQVELQYINPDMSGNKVFEVDSIVFDISKNEIKGELSAINYKTPVCEYEIEFTREVEDLSYVNVTIDNSATIDAITKDVTNSKKWSINVVFPITETNIPVNYTLDVSYNSKILQNVTEINTYIPKITTISLTSPVTYINTNANILINFDKEILNDFTLSNMTYNDVSMNEVTITTSTPSTQIEINMDVNIDYIRSEETITINYYDIVTEYVFVLDVIKANLSQFTISKETFTYLETNTTMTLLFDRELVETNEILHEHLIFNDAIFSISNLQQSENNSLQWDAIVTVISEVDVETENIGINYNTITIETNLLIIHTVVPYITNFILENNTFWYDDNIRTGEITFSREIIDTGIYLEANCFTYNNNIVLSELTNSETNNLQWRFILTLSEGIEEDISEFIVSYRGSSLSTNLHLYSVIPTIESIDIANDALIIDRTNTLTNDISEDVSKTLVTFTFTNPVSTTDNNILSYITLRNRKLETIPMTDLSFDELSTSDNKVWTAYLLPLKYELYLVGSQILINFKSIILAAKIDIDTVTTVTFTNKLSGPNNVNIITNYKPGYELKRINGKIIPIFSEGMQYNSNAILGFNEKKFEYSKNSSSVIPIGYDTSLKLYNKLESEISENGLNNSIGFINANAYKYIESAGFFKFTVQNKTYINSLTTIIADALSDWLKIVSIPDVSKMTNETEHRNYDLTIDFKIRALNNKQIESTITSRVGNNIFGTSFAKKSLILIDETYIDSQVNSFSGEIDSERSKSAIKVRLLREIGNILGIGHFWKLQDAPLCTDTLGKHYYYGVNGFRKYKDAFVYFPNVFGIPVEDYNDELFYLEEGVEGNVSKNVTLDGITHPGLDNELMTHWIDFPSTGHPISAITAGLLEDIGYDVCYNSVQDYTAPSAINNSYNIYLNFDVCGNIYSKLSNDFVNINNKYVMILSDDDADIADNVIKSMTDFVSIIETINGNISVIELTIIYNSTVDLSTQIDELTIFDTPYTILKSTQNTTQFIEQQKYKISIININNQYKILMEKQYHV